MTASRRTTGFLERESRGRVYEAQQQNIIRVDHRGVCGIAMFLPYWSAVKSIQGLCTCIHVIESAQPDESIWVIQIIKLSDDLHSHCLLRFDKFTVEKFNQFIAPAWMKCVLSEFKDRRIRSTVHTRSNSMIQ